MTVVAGASLFSGVVLAADTRATYVLRDGREIVVDHLQKVIPISEHVGLGYAGHVLIAGDLTFRAIRQLGKWADTNRRTTVSILTWLHRFFAWRFGQISHRFARPGVTFVLAAVLKGRPNIVERAKVVELMERFRLGNLAYQRNWLPNVLVEVLMTPPQATHVALQREPAGVLCVLSSPTFAPQCFAPLSAVAVGSGEAAIAQIEHEADWVFAGDVGNIHVETQALVQAVRHYTLENHVPGVGGLFCSMKVSQEGCRMMTFGTEMPAGGTRIELALNARGRLEQRNQATGRTIELRYPWEILDGAPAADERFDDLDDIERRLIGDEPLDA